MSTAFNMDISQISVPRTGLFYEPFLRDLDLIWRIDVSPTQLHVPPKHGIKHCQSSEYISKLT
jgi:hypothetical protein